MSDIVVVVPRRSVGGLVFDATFSEQHTSELKVTDNPVETGVTVSDHAYMSPDSITIEAGVTDAQLVTRADDPFSTQESRSRKAWELLKELQRSAEPFEVQTGLQLYSNMVCTNITATQDFTNASSLIFTATIREVIRVSTKIVKYPPRKTGPTNQQASAPKAKGEQQGTDVAATKKQSLLMKLKSMAGK